MNAGNITIRSCYNWHTMVMVCCLFQNIHHQGDSRHLTCQTFRPEQPQQTHDHRALQHQIQSGYETHLHTPLLRELPRVGRSRSRLNMWFSNTLSDQNNKCSEQSQFQHTELFTSRARQITCLLR